MTVGRSECTSQNRSRMCVALDHHLRARTHPVHEAGEVASGFFFRNVDHMVGHGMIISSLLGCGPSVRALGSPFGKGRRVPLCPRFGLA